MAPQQTLRSALQKGGKGPTVFVRDTDPLPQLDFASAARQELGKQSNKIIAHRQQAQTKLTRSNRSRSWDDVDEEGDGVDDDPDGELLTLQQRLQQAENAGLQYTGVLQTHLLQNGRLARVQVLSLLRALMVSVQCHLPLLAVQASSSLTMWQERMPLTRCIQQEDQDVPLIKEYQSEDPASSHRYFDPLLDSVDSVLYDGQDKDATWTADRIMQALQHLLQEPSNVPWTMLLQALTNILTQDADARLEWLQLVPNRTDLPRTSVMTSSYVYRMLENLPQAKTLRSREELVILLVRCIVIAAEDASHDAHDGQPHGAGGDTTRSEGSVAYRTQCAALAAKLLSAVVHVTGAVEVIGEVQKLNMRMEVDIFMLDCIFGTTDAVVCSKAQWLALLQALPAPARLRLLCLMVARRYTATNMETFVSLNAAKQAMDSWGRGTAPGGFEVDLGDVLRFFARSPKWAVKAFAKSPVSPLDMVCQLVNACLSCKLDGLKTKEVREHLPVINEHFQLSTDKIHAVQLHMLNCCTKLLMS